MKRAVLFALIVCLFLIACVNAAFAEGAAKDAPMTAEQLWQAGDDAWKAKDYDKAMEYYQMAADQGNAEGWRSIGSLYYYGEGVWRNDS